MSEFKDGIINVLKPTGMTSFDVVNTIKRQFNTKKVGHTGTLDPNAAGVLIVCIGRGVKLSNYLTQSTKSYRCSMHFGKETETLDSYGQIIETSPYEPIPIEKIQETLEKFTGEIDQIPPKYSAIKVNGKKLYQYALKGQQVEIKPRKVTINKIKLVKYQYPQLIIDVECSKGTYIRTLVSDMARSLNQTAYMSYLIRTSVDRYKIEDSVVIENLNKESIIPLDEIQLDMPKVQLDHPRDIERFKVGLEIFNKQLVKPLEKYMQTEDLAVYTSTGTFLGIGIITENEEKIKYLKTKKLIKID